ncbi:MAG: class I SAM-dependent methyltransferase [Candidatus Micrarchaeota archaeon]|nr:class I SAM-dependent methyltransferase [Candidatus Micrarchaeota archaeon]
MDFYLQKLLKRAPHFYAWEKDYKMRGELWRGPSVSFSFQDFLPAGAKVLELGCGDGKTLTSLIASGFKVTGIDVSPSAIKIARKKAGRKAKLVVGDVCELPFAANSFDAVVTVHVLDHLSQKERGKAVVEISRVLKKDGLLFFEGFSQNDFRFGNGLTVERNTFRRKNNVWYHYFSVAEVKRLFKGFSAVELREECVEKTRQRVKRCVVKLIALWKD